MTESPTSREWMQWMDYLVTVWGWLWVAVSLILLLGKILIWGLP